MIDERTRIAQMIGDALWVRGIVIDGFADKLAHDIVKAVNTGSLERIATSMEKIAERGAPPMAQAHDRLMREQARCPRCKGYHNQLAACLT